MTKAERDAEMLAFIRENNGMLEGFQYSGFRSRFGWGLASAGDTLRRLMEYGLVERAFPDRQPMLPVRLTALGRNQRSEEA